MTLDEIATAYATALRKKADVDFRLEAAEARVRLLEDESRACVDEVRKLRVQLLEQAAGVQPAETP